MIDYEEEMFQMLAMKRETPNDQELGKRLRQHLSRLGKDIKKGIED